MVCKEWRFKARSAVRGVLGRAREGWGPGQGVQGEEEGGGNRGGEGREGEGEVKGDKGWRALEGRLGEMRR